MPWKTLGDALENALASRLNEVGEGVAAATAPDAVKAQRAPGPKPRPVGSKRIRNQRQGEVKPDGSGRAHMDTALPMGRRMTVATASPKAVGSPTRAAVIRLVIDNGDRPERREEQLSGRSIAQARGGRRASNLVRLVHSAASS